MTTKRCPGCNTTKPLSDFGRNRARKSGYADLCRECTNARQRKYHADRGKPRQPKPVKVSVPKHEHIYVQYQRGAQPICFRCHFWTVQQRRKGVLMTEEKIRERTRNNARVKASRE